MFIDTVDDFVEHFDSYLMDGETIDSFTIDADDGLIIVSSAKNTAETDIDYLIRADGADGTDSNPLLQAKIVVTTSDTRVEIRIIDFNLLESEI